MEKVITQIRDLISEHKIKQAQELYKEHKEELDNHFVKNNFKSVEGHLYSGYNKLYLSLFSKPGIYGTFKQWISNGRKVKKGEKAKTIFMPIFYNSKEGEEKEIKFMKRLFIFHKNQTEKLV